MKLINYIKAKKFHRAILLSLAVSKKTQHSLVGGQRYFSAKDCSSRSTCLHRETTWGNINTDESESLTEKYLSTRQTECPDHGLFLLEFITDKEIKWQLGWSLSQCKSISLSRPVCRPWPRSNFPLTILLQPYWSVLWRIMPTFKQYKNNSFNKRKNILKSK